MSTLDSEFEDSLSYQFPHAILFTFPPREKDDPASDNDGPVSDESNPIPDEDDLQHKSTGSDIDTSSNRSRLSGLKPMTLVRKKVKVTYSFFGARQPTTCSWELPCDPKKILVAIDGKDEKDKSVITRTLPMNPYLTEEQADFECASETPETLLHKLNSITAYDLEISEPNLEAGLGILIENGHDFGMAYAWFRLAFRFVSRDMESREAKKFLVAEYVGLRPLQLYDLINLSPIAPISEDMQMKETAWPGEDSVPVLINSPTRPRRVWDLVANRIIPEPWAVTGDRDELDSVTSKSGGGYSAISHSWAPVSELKFQLTPINGLRWPVPVPANTSLQSIREQVRSLTGLSREMRHDQAGKDTSYKYRTIYIEHCWLDILCLRQTWCNSRNELLVDPARADPDYLSLEKTRLEEWKVDVPRIGAIYRQATEIMVYLNGIGHEEVIEDAKEWEKPTHWSQRAWTLQEWVVNDWMRPRVNPIFMGVKLQEGLEDPAKEFGEIQDRLCRRLKDQGRLPPQAHIGSIESLRALLRCVMQRHASNGLDRIVGLYYFFPKHHLPTFPPYHPKETIVEAWTRLLDAFSNSFKLKLAAGILLPEDRSHELFPFLLQPMFAMDSVETQDVLSQISNHDAHARNGQPAPRTLPIPLYWQPMVAQIAIPLNIVFQTSSSMLHDPWMMESPPGSFQLFYTDNPEQIPTGGARVKTNFKPLPGKQYYILSPSMRRVDEFLYIYTDIGADGQCSGSPSGPLEYYCGAQEAYGEPRSHPPMDFLVCSPYKPEEVDDWNGINYEKIGTAHLPEGVDYETSKALSIGVAQAVAKEYSRYPTSDWMEVIDDIIGRSLSASEMCEKYGPQPVYSIISNGDPVINGDQDSEGELEDSISDSGHEMRAGRPNPNNDDENKGEGGPEHGIFAPIAGRKRRHDELD